MIYARGGDEICMIFLFHIEETEESIPQES